DAERGLLVQEIGHAWRYSIGNPYEELSFAESLDVAEVMAGYGYGDIAENILRFALRRLPEHFTAWRAGERLLAGAVSQRMCHDRAYVEEETPALATALDELAHKLRSNDLLARERYSTDIGKRVYGLHGETAVWAGLLAMGRVWAETGQARLAARCRSLAAPLQTRLRPAGSGSERVFPDGSPVRPAGLPRP